MREELALLEAIRAQPNELGLRLVYADWLEERGDPRGTFLRLDIEFQQLENVRNAKGGYNQEYLELWNRRGLMIRELMNPWFASCLPRGQIMRPFFSGGMVWKVKCNGNSLQNCADVLFARCPALVALRMFDASPRELMYLANHPLSKQITQLDLSFASLGADHARSIAKWKHPPILTHLDLSQTSIFDEGVALLAASVAVSKLESLQLMSCGLGNPAAIAISQSLYLESLTSLNLSGNRISAEAAQAVSDSPHLTALDSFRWR